MNYSSERKTRMSHENYRILVPAMPPKMTLDSSYAQRGHHLSLAVTQSAILM